MTDQDLKVDVSMPDFPTPPPTSDTSKASPASTVSSDSSSLLLSRGLLSSASIIASSDLGPDYTPAGEKIKRPMNAFMVWAQIRRAEITAASDKVHNSLISKALGVEWRAMTNEQKEPYVEKAKDLRDELFRNHPNYVYRPRKRKQRHAPYSPKDASISSHNSSPSSTSLPSASINIAKAAQVPTVSSTSLALPDKFHTSPLTETDLHKATTPASPELLAALATTQFPFMMYPNLVQSPPLNQQLLGQLLYAQLLSQMTTAKP